VKPAHHGVATTQDKARGGDTDTTARGRGDAGLSGRQGSSTLGSMMASDSARPSVDGLIKALHASGPSADHVDKLMLFGQFVGSWDIEWSGTGVDGAARRLRGELHFGWVLGGRAVQDVWIVPGRGEPAEAQPGLGFHGSTLRFYDPTIDAWRSTWIEPVNGRVRRFVGRPAGGDIVLISDEDDPQLRWLFTDITPRSFRWRGELSHDGGCTWAFDEEMIVTRASDAVPVR
jgi:hypothetical protein